jgi:hypothetical protein
MSRRPPIQTILAAACLLVAACGNAVPRPSSAPTPTGPTPTATEGAAPGDLDGLVVLTGGELSVVTPAGVVKVAGPGGVIDGMSAASGRVIVRTTGAGFAIAEVDPTGSLQPVWRPANVPNAEIPDFLSRPALSPRGDRVAMARSDPATPIAGQVVVVDTADGELATTALGRETNGPPVWIDDKTVLVEVLPKAGGSRFLRVDLATGRLDPVNADGYGPAISGDGSLLVIASTDGSVLAVPTASWLARNPPDEGALVDASGSPFQLAIDAAGRRIAIGYGDAAGDPVSIAVFVRDGGAWRRSERPVAVAPGTLTMLSWLD